MHHTTLRNLLLSCSVALACGLASAQQPAPGLRLYTAYRDTETHLVDTAGQVVHTWSGTGPGLVAHLMPDGSLLRSKQTRSDLPNGVTGGLQRIAFDGTVLWDLDFDGPTAVMHHDIEPMPNGNVLVIAWDVLTYYDAVAMGRDPALLTSDEFLPDAIYELQQTGPNTAVVVWEWHLTDHLVQEFDSGKPNYGVVAQHPELVDLNYPPVVLGDGDWNHANGLDYDPLRDLIVLSSRAQGEIYVIDHSTTRVEAAGHTGGRYGRGGDILWRWGNPQAYGRGRAVDQQLVGQHDPRFVPPGYPGAGNITVFDNGTPASFSAVHELELPVDGNRMLQPAGDAPHGPLRPLWSFEAEPLFFSIIMSGAQRLPNGNTLICSAVQETIFEITRDGTPVWGFTAPPNPNGGITLLFQSDYVERSLWVSAHELSASAGGQLDFAHLLGSPHAGETCMLLGSTTGTWPGTTLGGLRLPLNDGPLFQAMAGQPNSAPWSRTLHRLGSAGDGTSTIVMAPQAIPAAAAGLTLHFAHLTFDTGGLPSAVSPPITLTITP